MELSIPVFITLPKVLVPGIGNTVLINELCPYFFPYPVILAQESRRVTTRLKTGLPGVESFRSTQK